MDFSTIDSRELLADLGIDAITAIERVQYGADNAIWRVEAGGVAYALRLMRRPEAEPVRRELAAMRAAEAGGIRVPHLYAFTVWRGTPAMLLEWLPGKTAAEVAMSDPSAAVALAHQMGALQARIHAIAPPPELIVRPTAWLDWLDGEDALKARLAALPARPAALLHLDFHPQNLLVNAADGMLSVIDWTNARAGDPRADFARTYTLLRVEPWLLPLPVGLLAQMRRTLTRAWWQGYVSIAGTPADLPLFFVWAGALMAQDLAPRADNPDHPFGQQHLAHIRRWTDYWRHCADI